LLPLCFEGSTRGLGHPSQLEDRGILLLTGLSQLLVEDTLLDQLLAETRDLRVPKLESGLRPLQRRAFPLEMALCLLLSQTLALEGSSGLDKGGPLLLVLDLHLLACDSFLPKLLFCRGEGGSLVRQAGPQLLGLLGILLGLALPSSPSRVARSCWSWARAVATSVSHSVAKARTPARSSRAFYSASSHERCPHLLDCRGVLHSPGV
jgi:hypothetical protein